MSGAAFKAMLAAFDALERGPRRYSGDPAVDQFRRECDRDLVYRVPGAATAVTSTPQDEPAWSGHGTAVSGHSEIA